MEAYVIENNMYITKVEVLRKDAAFYTIRFPNGSESCLRSSRLYMTETDAEDALKNKLLPQIPAPHEGYRPKPVSHSHWDYPDC